MVAAFERLRAKGIAKLNDLGPAKGCNENMLLECERFLREGGYDDAGIDAKMRHVVDVHEAEAESLGHADFFKSALIWDTKRPDRFPRKIETSLDEARRAGAAPRRSAARRSNSGAIGPSTPHKSYRDGRCMLPFDVAELSDDAITAYENDFLAAEARGCKREEAQRIGRQAALAVEELRRAPQLELAAGGQRS